MFTMASGRVTGLKMRQAPAPSMRAARYLMDAIVGNAHHGVDYAPCRLIQRESTLPLDWARAPSFMRR